MTNPEIPARAEAPKYIDTGYTPPDWLRFARTVFFGWLAIRSVRVSRGEPFALLVLLSLLTAVLSAFLDNVTTVLLTTPITLAVARRLDRAARPVAERGSEARRSLGALTPAFAERVQPEPYHTRSLFSSRAPSGIAVPSHTSRWSKLKAPGALAKALREPSTVALSTCGPGPRPPNTALRGSVQMP